MCGRIILLSGVLLISACAGNSRGNHSEKTAVSAVAAVDTAGDLPLPEVPAGLQAGEERAAYVAEHFWDAMDFADTLRGRNRGFMEQNFANFLTLFPHVPETARAAAVSKLMRRAEADTAAYRLLAEIAEKYLYDPNSPMRNEEFFIPFLQELGRTSLLDEFEKTRPAFLLRAVMKNRPGMRAADFTYIVRDGRRCSLYGTQAPLVLLIFYDPDCENCKEVTAALSGNGFLNRLIADGQLTVLAVYADGDRAAWERTKADMPADWTVAFDTGRIGTEELYVLPATPVIYLLDGNKRVLLKDASPQQVLEALTALVAVP